MRKVMNIVVIFFKKILCFHNSIFLKMVEWIPICSVNENNLTVPYVKLLYKALSERLPWMSFVVDESLDDKTLLTMAWQRIESVQKTHQTMLVPHWLQLAQPAAPNPTPNVSYLFDFILSFFFL